MRTHTLKSGVLTTAILAAMAGLASSAHGQNREWVNPVSAAWNVPANWSGANTPDSGAENAVLSVLGTYTVTMPSGYSATVGALSISNPLAELVRADSGTLYVSSISNDGLVRVGNGAGINGTGLRSNATGAPISGTGTIRLAAGPNLDTALIAWNSNSSTQTFAQEAGHSIRGTGNIYAAMSNAGLIDADVAATTLQLFSQNKSNSGVMRASLGTLQINGITVTQTPEAQVSVTGGTLNLLNCAIVGGSILNSGGNVNVTGTSTLSGVIKTGSMQVANNVGLYVSGGSLSNTGSLFVNTGAGTSASALQSLGTMQVLSGPGEVVLQATEANLDTAQVIWVSNSSTQSFRQLAGHTIRGTGNIHANLDNQGLVHADQNGRTLQLLSIGKTNTGMLRASNGGNLQLNGIGLTNTGGVLEALTGSTCTVTNSGVVEGTLQSAGTGLFRIIGTSAFTSVQNSAPISVLDNAVMQVTTNIVNNNVITVNDTAGSNQTGLKALNAVSLSGSGEVVLNASANLDTAFIQWNSNPSTQTFSQVASHTIRGTGNVYSTLTNAGLVHADRAGKTLQLFANNKINTGTFRASGGGNLQFSGITVTNTGGVIEALAGSTCTVINSGVVEGTLQSAGTGLFRIIGTSAFTSVQNSAPISVLDNAVMQVTTNIVNNNVITVNDTAGSNQTGLKALNAVSLSGSGEVVLNASANLDTAFIQWNSNPSTQTFSQVASHTIRGTGNVYSTLTNAGLVHADRAGKTLQLLANNKINTGTYRASGGGNLQINGVTVTNTGGVIEALAGSTASYINAAVVGGTLRGEGVHRTSGTTDFYDLTAAVPVPIRAVDNSSLRFGGTIVNDGVITINETSGSNNTSLRALNVVTLAGTGLVELNASGNLDSAHIVWNSNASTQRFINSATHTIAGNGNIYSLFTNNGIFSPGVGNEASGQLNFPSQVCTMTGTSRFECDINGTAAADYDRLTGPANKALNGTIAVRLGYPATVGDTFDVVTGPYTGRFSVLELARGYYIEYGATVRIGYSGCIGDWDQDGDVDSDDILDFFTDFETGEADYDEDGDTDSDDIILFFGSFESGC